MTRFVIILLLALCRVAAAHPMDFGYVHLEPAGNSIGVTVDLDIDAAAVLLGVDAAKLDTAALSARVAELAAASYARSPITTAAGPCTWGARTVTRIDRQVRITDTATCPGDGERTWAFPMIRDGKVSPTFEFMVKETVGGHEQLTLVDRYKPELVLGVSSQDTSFGGLVWSGVEHIGAAPSQWHDEDGAKLPDGLDHILFLLALILGGGTLLQLIGIATGFTIGHSITLALTALDIVHIPPSVIEPLIALSIAFVAVEAITGLWKKHRWKIATFFGLIHGFGFGYALEGLDLSTGEFVKALFAFNLGVELGQIMLMVVLVPLVLLAHRNKTVTPYVIKGLAGLIFIAGMYWTIERIVS